MSLYGYGLALTWNVPLLSIVNIETQWRPYARGRILVPKTQPVEEHPVRETALSGRERGDGLIRHAWFVRAAPVELHAFMYDTYYDGGDSVSPKVTVLQRDHIHNTYQRWNAYLMRPIAGQEYRYQSYLVLDVTYRFHLMEKLG